MDVVAAIFTCSLYADDALVRAIVDNAHDNPLSIFTPERDPETGTLSSAPPTVDAATARLREIMTQGGQPLVGLMQVPAIWASIFGREPQDLFDPCINVSIGTAMLSEFDYACARATSMRGSGTTRPIAVHSRDCAVRRYAQAIHAPELMAVVALSLRYQHARPTPPADAPINPAGDALHGWGPNWLFIPMAND